MVLWFTVVNEDVEFSVFNKFEGYDIYGKENKREIIEILRGDMENFL